MILATTFLGALACPACGGVRTLSPTYFVATGIMLLVPAALVVALVLWLRSAARR